MDKFQNKYRIPSARAKWWNYNANGIYFITICTSGHDYYFGQIMNKQMVLSDIGILVQKKWEKSFIIRKELQCDTFVIMPNHIHAILRIENDNPVETHGSASPNSNDLLRNRDAPPCVSTTIQSEHSHPVKNYGIAYRSPKSISSFVAGFKSVVTVNALKINSCFGWQARFYDNIARNDQDYQRIADYIENNPVNWEQDIFFRNDV